MVKSMAPTLTLYGTPKASKRFSKIGAYRRFATADTAAMGLFHIRVFPIDGASASGEQVNMKQVNRRV